MDPISDKHHILLLPRLKFQDLDMRTLSNMQAINKSSFDDLFEFLRNRLTLGNENYKILPISSIIFSYGIRDGKFKPTILKNNKDTITDKYQQL